ncbi:lipid-A-disaccharide synthase, partial [Bacteroidales bacterium OttesenSCG-928-I14]|nr:lipid-A-disaccharide synthase [Bacteroidales bacterium OttesenSCG-928-I14]
MKYYLIAGEASGDLHASHLMHSLKEVDKDAEFRFFGGDLMQAQGGTLVKHYKEMAFMGFIPVLMNLRTIMSNMKFCKQDIQAFDPDKIIFIDYPGFNLKIAKFLKEEYVSKTGKKPTNIYYISPKIWAWKTYRIHSIKKYIDKMLCILPFEVEFYKKHDFAIDYVGNPTVDEVRDFQSKPIQTIA